MTDSYYPYCVVIRSDLPSDLNTSSQCSLKWCLQHLEVKTDNTQARWQIGIKNFNLLRFSFHTVEDAIMFKLRWGND